MGVPDSLAECMLEDRRALKNWEIDGVDGEPPSRRKKFLLHAHAGKLYVHGGEGKEGDVYDDLYMLDMGEKRWTCLYKGENVNALSASGRRVAFCGNMLVSVSVGSPGMLDAVTMLDMTKLTASEAQFVPTMAANLSERLEGITAPNRDKAEL